MKTRFTIMAMAGIAFTIWALPVLSEDSTAEQQRSYYLKCINDEIS